MLEMPTPRARPQEPASGQPNPLETTLTPEQHAEILSLRLQAVMPTVPPPPPLPPSLVLPPLLPPANPAPTRTALASASQTLREGVGESLRGLELERLQLFIAAERAASQRERERERERERRLDAVDGIEFIETIDLEAVRAAASTQYHAGDATMSMRPLPGGRTTVAQQIAEASAVLEAEAEAEAGVGGGGAFVGAPFDPSAEDAAREVYLGILRGAPDGRRARICDEVAPAFRDLFDAEAGADGGADGGADNGAGAPARRRAALTAVVSGTCTYGGNNTQHSDGGIMTLPHELFTVGREPWNDVVVSCPCISRLHLVAFIYPTRIVLIDGWSKCGTKVLERGNQAAEMPSSMPGSRRAIVIPRGEPVTLELGPDAKITFDPKPCAICYEKMRSVRYRCGHLVACEGCHQSMLQQSRNAVYPCPTCRNIVAEHSQGVAGARRGSGGVLRGSEARACGMTFVGEDLEELHRLIAEAKEASGGGGGGGGAT